MNADPVYIFRKTWGTYQKVISNNLMFHSEIMKAVREIFETRPGALNVLDLGCGDAAHVGRILKPVQVAEYWGCDLSPYALDVARKNLEPFGGNVKLLCRDMVAVLKEAPADHFDVVYSSYAVHHLSVEQKQTFFMESSRALREEGYVILVDVMRDEGQSRPDYIDSYSEAVATQWDALTSVERGQLQEHIRNCDFPETPTILQSLAHQAGLKRCRRIEKRTWHEAWCFQE